MTPPLVYAHPLTAYVLVELHDSLEPRFRALMATDPLVATGSVWSVGGGVTAPGGPPIDVRVAAGDVVLFERAAALRIAGISDALGLLHVSRILAYVGAARSRFSRHASIRSGAG